MPDHPNKEVVDKLMEKIKRYAALAKHQWPIESKETEKDIENSLYVAIDTAFDRGHDQGSVTY
tara:strand:- start:119 stop:307 length:189 start_codon:yes stop_codon:yes gene_type:complete